MTTMFMHDKRIYADTQITVKAPEKLYRHEGLKIWSTKSKNLTITYNRQSLNVLAMGAAGTYDKRNIEKLRDMNNTDVIDALHNYRDRRGYLVSMLAVDEENKIYALTLMMTNKVGVPKISNGAGSGKAVYLALHGLCRTSCVNSFALFIMRGYDDFSGGTVSYIDITDDKTCILPHSEIKECARLASISIFNDLFPEVEPLT